MFAGQHTAVRSHAIRAVPRRRSVRTSRLDGGVWNATVEFIACHRAESNLGRFEFGHTSAGPWVAHVSRVLRAM
jgi:hypothetical protein